MPACPNCGRQTLRTIDWACQWCGYPLVSRAFKKIDKTFKELQEERSLASRSAPSEEEEPEFEPEYTPEPENEPEPELRTRPPVKPAYNPVLEPKPEPKPAPEAVSRPVPPPPPPERPIIPPRQEPAPQPEQPVIQLPPPAPEPAPPPRVEIPRAPEPMITPHPLLKQELPPAPKQVVTPPAPRPEIKVQPEPAPAPAVAVKLEDIRDGMEITADQIDMLFRTDRSAANAKLAGKTLVISGIVEKVFIREHLEIRYIMLTGAQKKMTWSIRCTFDKDESSKLTRLNEGQAVAVRSKYDSYSKNIIFKECVLV